jgi:hypothetical protein
LLKALSHVINRKAAIEQPASRRGLEISAAAAGGVVQKWPAAAVSREMHHFCEKLAEEKLKHHFIRNSGPA